MKMDKKVLLALPLSLLSLVSCNGTEDIEWKDDAESIFVLFGVDQYGSSRGYSFEKKEIVNMDGRETTIVKNDFAYYENGDTLRIKTEKKTYSVMDYAKGYEPKEKDMISRVWDIYKYKGYQYQIAYEHGVWEKQ